jgi:hypothetical protein
MTPANTVPDDIKESKSTLRIDLLTELFSSFFVSQRTKFDALRESGECIAHFFFDLGSA